jgi:anti-sigma B factor antagonist
MEVLVAESVSDAEVAVIRPVGRLDAFQSPALSHRLDEQASKGVHTILIDLEKVEFVDSIALSTLVRALKHALQAGGELALCSVQQPVQVIFELTRLDKAFHLYSTEQAALDALTARR